MLYKQFFITAFAAMAWRANAVPEPQDAMAHGEYSELNGRVFRYHQLARGIFSSVPAEEWDETIHQRSDEVWDLDLLATRGIDDDGFNGTSHLGERNLVQQCSVAYDCAKQYGKATIELGWYLWLAAANKAESTGAKKGLISFLGSSFVANAGGVAIAGVISAHINGQANPAPAACSTANSEADLVSNALAAAMRAQPMATEITIKINGPGGASWSLTMSAVPAGQTPVPVCK